ncbi:MAG: Stk1 family PASTA domain-containing Ser/Thr kinase [Eubacteriales bacterium]
MDNYIGKLLDNRYEIMEVIGVGGMAIVYKARCHRLNRLVAIKILKDDLSKDAEFRRRFHGESQAVAMLSHSNIVNVYDVSHSDACDYIVMELIDGVTLKQYMQQKGMLNWREVLHFSTQIANALEHAHSRGIVHRDIKPHNIMLLKDGSVKVADFGIARITSSQSTLTREALGSVHYISPEQARGSRVDNRSDLYSLGVVMYEMMTGRPPFEGESPVAVAIQHINATPVQPSEENPEIPVALEQITMHAMTANMDLRYSDAKEILRDLEEFRKNPSVTFYFPTTTAEGIIQETVAAAQPERRRASESMSQRRERSNTPRSGKPAKKGSAAAVVAGVLCLVLAIGGIGYFLYSFFLADLFAVSEEVDIPDFVGEVYANIDHDDYPDFIIIEEQWINSTEAEAGVVLRQTPTGDTTAKVGTTIYLTISAGQKSDFMPAFAGKTQSEAVQSLEDVGLNLFVKTTESYHDTMESGYIISTDPVAGESLSEGQTITLTISLGAETTLIPVPALLGKDIDEALAELGSMKLGLGEAKEVEDGSVPKGTVTFQSVPQDTLVKEGYVINLHYATGPVEEEEVEEEVEEEKPEEEEPSVEEEEELYLDLTDGEVILTVPLRTGNGTVKCTIYVDRVQYGEHFSVQLGAATMDIAVKGSGVQTVDVYYDGTIGYSQEVDFG